LPQHTSPTPSNTLVCASLACILPPLMLRRAAPCAAAGRHEVPEGVPQSLSATTTTTTNTPLSMLVFAPLPEGEGTGVRVTFSAAPLPLLLQNPLAKVWPAPRQTAPTDNSNLAFRCQCHCRQCRHFGQCPPRHPRLPFASPNALACSALCGCRDRRGCRLSPPRRRRRRRQPPSAVAHHSIHAALHSLQSTQLVKNERPRNCT